MKKNRLYTMMAVAMLLTAGCSDDIENGGNNINTPVENGDRVYMAVNISSVSGAETKAPTGGEAGDGQLVGSDTENAVNNGWIYLIPTNSETATLTGTVSYDESTVEDLTKVQSDEDIKIYGTFTNNILGEVGSEIGNATAGTQHRPAVLVSFSTSEIEYNKYYQILAITNAPNLPEFTTLHQLRDYLQTTAWEGDGTTVSSCSNFVMSTHQMYQADGDPAASEIKFVESNTEDNPAVASVYVERLAARIDLAINTTSADDETKGFKVANSIVLENGTNQDYVKLTDYAVVNQMQAGTYMLKRVSSRVQSQIADIPTDGKQLYLEDEIWSDSGTTPQYNYVLDPWTMAKSIAEIDWSQSFTSAAVYTTGGEGSATTTVAKKQTQLYKYPFVSDLNDVTNLFKRITETEDFTPICYTQENTVNHTQQKNGFSTGLVFKGTYTPGHLSEYDPAEGSVKAVENSTQSTSFYVVDDVYNAKASRYLSADLRTAGVLSFKTADQSVEKALIQYLFNTADETTVDFPSSTVSLAELNAIVAKIRGGKLAQAYKAYLEGKLKDQTELTADVQQSLKWSAFVSSVEESAPIAVPTTVDAKENLIKNYGVSYYENGECYYKYWIRHANNNNNNQMGVMEFAIVRNNVYQVQVNGVSALGDPLPFTPGEDDPDTDDEDDDVYIKIKIYVKDWVVRKNSSIIL